MAIEARRDVFQAIADPTRRQIINLVANQRMSLNGISAHFNISRPAISQQVKILVDCGLLLIRQEGRERICEARLDTLSEVAAWVDQYRQFWTQQFDSLDTFLQKSKAEKGATSNKKTSSKNK